ncbi:ZIP family metal transporter [Oceanicoccus sagamiensis]|uniref:Divalent cation transporter n=1 Tax=Oceanicoccus sagamiensis TaxID=716816 RepID=A0A1X9NF14_9GAMM|nr:divalent cation transporter [Oceanicoccus sagamiensis]ARN74129.1 divalent cation transporter [Oceanicoccus sagamiensis]
MLLTVITSTLLAGLAMPLGAFVASIEHISPDWLEQEFRHTVTAFGGGALLSAVALVLVPEGINHLPVAYACAFFIGGGLSFMLLDRWLARHKTPASQLAAMLSDFIPESLALGAAFASGNSTALLLAALIGLQNLPEGFSAYREIKSSSSQSTVTIIAAFAAMALFGPAAGITGYLWLHDAASTIAAIMLFAAGGILYSIFQDIAPQVKLEKHFAPPMGALLGFSLGLTGFMLTT